MLENFIYSKQKSLFEDKLNNGEVLDEAIAFIEDTKEIWNHGTYFDCSSIDLTQYDEIEVIEIDDSVKSSYVAAGTFDRVLSAIDNNKLIIAKYASGRINQLVLLQKARSILIFTGNAHILTKTSSGYNKFVCQEVVQLFSEDVVDYSKEEIGIPDKLSVLTNDSDFITTTAAKSYTDTAIANLIDSAPDTLNTLNELATAILEHQDVTDALDAAITNKADKTELPTKVSELENDEKYIKGLRFVIGGNGLMLNQHQYQSAYITADSTFTLPDDISSSTWPVTIKGIFGLDSNVHNISWPNDIKWVSRPSYYEPNSIYIYEISISPNNVYYGSIYKADDDQIANTSDVKPLKDKVSIIESNYVTTNTEQTISGKKTFTDGTIEKANKLTDRKYDGGKIQQFQEYLTLYKATRTDNSLPRGIYDNGWNVILESPLFKSNSSDNLYSFIHTGNIAEQTVASANKLSTPRTIWGQSFDGTGDVSGSIFVPNNSSLIFKDTKGSNMYVFQLSSSDTLHIGNDTAIAGYDTYLNGNKVYLRYGTSRNVGLTLDNLGNVGIGTTSPAYKLDVNGTFHTSGAATFDSMTYINSSLYNYNSDKTYRLCFDHNVSSSLDVAHIYNVTSDGNHYGKLYFGSTGGTDISIVNSKVGIGTATPEKKLHVVGYATFDGSIAVTGSLYNYNSDKTYRLCFDHNVSSSLDVAHIYNITSDGNHYGKLYFGSTGGTDISIVNSKVGIGTATPEKKLHVVGDATFDGSIAVTGSLTVGGKNVLVSGGLTKSDVTTALGYTPEYISGLSVSGDTITLKSKAGTTENQKTATIPGLSKVSRIESYTTATTVASLNVNYSSIYVTLSANASLSVSAIETTYNGRSITAYVYTSAARTITIPTTGYYVSMCGSSYTTKAGGWVEFNLTCISGVWHIVMLEQQ